MKQLSGDQLHQNLLIFTRQERKILNQILDHLAEVNRRKLFLKFGHDSLLKYCVKELKYSESAAYRRIKALRITQELPHIKKNVENGELNLTQLCKAQDLFENRAKETRKKLAPEAKSEILEKVKLKSSFDSENQIRKELKMPPKKRKIQIEATQEEFEKWVRYKGAMVHKNMTDGLLLSLAIDAAFDVKFSAKRSMATPPKQKALRPVNKSGSCSREPRAFI